MANIKGNSAAIYSPVGSQKLNNNNFSSYDSWNGESFYIEDNKVYIENNGYISQKITGANKNEIWLLSANGKGSFKISIRFIDYNGNAIYRSSEQFSLQDSAYFSTYGVAPAKTNGVLIQVEGSGKVEGIKLRHLKPLIILSDWEGSLSREKIQGFETTSKIKFKGKAEEIREIESVNFDTFQAKEKIFIGFLENKSLFNRVEGKVSKMENLDNSYPVKFECNEVNIPMRDW